MVHCALCWLACVEELQSLDMVFPYRLHTVIDAKLSYCGMEAYLAALCFIYDLHEVLAALSC